MSSPFPLLAASAIASQTDAWFGSAGEGGVITMAVRLVLDLACALILVRGVYFRRAGRSDLFLTFVAFNLTIFVIARLLAAVELTTGSAFGLFAVFSVLRFRTENLSTRDMTYLFVLIALGLVMGASRVSLVQLAVVGVAMCVVMEVLEGSWLARRERSQPVVYEHIALVHADSRAALLDDLAARTGLRVHRVEVEEIDFVRDQARLLVYHFE